MSVKWKYGLLSHKKRVLLRKYHLIPGADPGFQVRGAHALKKIAPSRERRENCWGISCEKSRFYAKKIIFFPILGGEAWRVRHPPPLDPPLVPGQRLFSHFLVQIPPADAKIVTNKLPLDFFINIICYFCILMYI